MAIDEICLIAAAVVTAHADRELGSGFFLYGDLALRAFFVLIALVRNLKPFCSPYALGE